MRRGFAPFLPARRSPVRTASPAGGRALDARRCSGVAWAVAVYASWILIERKSRPARQKLGALHAFWSTMDKLRALSELVARRNAVSTEIAAILDRPAQLGHLGEFVASKLFDIQLEAPANNRGFDGRFSKGLLAGKTVDVKTYAKREGIIDLRVQDLPDYYLVLSGPRAPAASSRGKDRPWVIDGIHLFEARPLVNALLSRGVKVGVASSVSVEYWTKAELYPASTSELLPLSAEQRAWIERFGRDPVSTLKTLSEPGVLVRKFIAGVVRDLGRPYSDGTSNYEIHVASEHAEGLPHQVSQRIPVTVTIAGTTFGGGLRATAKNSYVWVCPDIVRPDGAKTTLGRVLTDEGFRANDKVNLSVDGSAIVVARA